ncbi:MAG TPA: Chromate resistance protein ChrB [Thermomicrobiales bacterium]|nr:Chromate resistance protein ChrB [Thermomicrobiales bacterium]
MDHATQNGNGWVVLVYRVPTEPARKRVAIWRELKRIGAFYLQQCVCAMPNRPELLDELDRITARITEMGGDATIFDVPALRPGDDDKLVTAVRELRDKEYAEIVEECETKFVKEIEFEHFRRNYTYEEAEEIRQDLDKIKRWFASIVARDWFGADGRQTVEDWIDRCEELLADFEDTVYRHSGDDTAAATAPPGSSPIPDQLRPFSTTPQPQPEEKTG